MYLLAGDGWFMVSYILCIVYLINLVENSVTFVDIILRIDG